MKDAFLFRDLSNNELICCALKVDIKNDDKVILTGSIGFTSILNRVFSNINIPDNNESNFEIIINNRTKLIDKITVNTKYKEGLKDVSLYLNTIYSNFNDDFTINEPESFGNLDSSTGILLKSAILTYIAESGDYDLSKCFKNSPKTVENLILSLQQTIDYDNYSFGPYLEIRDESPSVKSYLPEMGAWEITIENFSIIIEPSLESNLIIKE
jgi:hypothetical protein